MGAFMLQLYTDNLKVRCCFIMKFYTVVFGLQKMKCIHLHEINVRIMRLDRGIDLLSMSKHDQRANMDHLVIF